MVSYRAVTTYEQPFIFRVVKKISVVGKPRRDGGESM